jgi:hypothetical protein
MSELGSPSTSLALRSGNINIFTHQKSPGQLRGFLNPGYYLMTLSFNAVNEATVRKSLLLSILT